MSIKSHKCQGFNVCVICTALSEYDSQALKRLRKLRPRACSTFLCHRLQATEQAFVDWRVIWPLSGMEQKSENNQNFR